MCSSAMAIVCFVVGRKDDGAPVQQDAGQERGGLRADMLTTRSGAPHGNVDVMSEIAAHVAPTGMLE